MNLDSVIPGIIKSKQISSGQPGIELGGLLFLGFYFDDFFSTIVTACGTGMVRKHLIVALGTRE
jgi:hypothetical protein